MPVTSTAPNKPVRPGTPVSEPAPPVVLNDVGHRFGDSPWLFRGLSLDLKPGHVYGLTGPSGSGKSTLLSLLAGWEAPAAGSISRPAGAAVSWVFQNPHGVAARSALDHVSLPLLATGMTVAAAEDRATALLDRFGLLHAAQRPFSSLSGGEAQRLMLARGFASTPTLFLVDEPTAQLDPSTALEVDTALGALAGESVIVVVATHDPRTRDACTDVVDLGAYA